MANRATQKSSELSLYTAVFLVIILGHVATHSLQDEDKAVLLKLKKHWQNPPSLGHWSQSNSSHCSWPEINCTDNSVTSLSLIAIDLVGTVPPFICDLQNLKKLILQNNSLTDELPTALYNCSKLEHLDLSLNIFIGTVPSGIDRLDKLAHLNLAVNNFSGEIPASIGRLNELRYLLLSDNLFNGSFPLEIGNLTNLKLLALAYNLQLKPFRLPSNYSQLRDLKYLWIPGSNLIGEIPEKIGDLESLKQLDLSENSLSGKIPGSLFTLKNLRLLCLYGNKLTGEIPQVVEAINLDLIDLSENNLTGTIPEDFGNLNDLTSLNLGFNRLSGVIPESTGRLPALMDLVLFANNLSGKLPPDFGRYSMLREFDVASNRLTGKLPENLCYWGKLLLMVAFDNNLSGEFPQPLGNCTSLLVLDINNNGFTGKIPTGVFSWKSLEVFKAYNNLLMGSIPQELTALSALTTLLLHHNRLTGHLPTDIVSWKSLNTLNLARNQLSGPLPEKLGFLQSLADLDLSENQFSGQIPPEFGLLRLNLLNLSSNDLNGIIPSEFENAAYENSFLNNPGLCAVSQSVNLNKCNSSSKPIKSNKISHKSRALIIGSGAVIVFVFCVLLLLVIIIKRYRKKHALCSQRMDFELPRLNLEESQILSGLTENNVIGHGGSGKVYRVSVNNGPHGDDVFAVKRIRNDWSAEKNFEKQFNAEVEVLLSIRHPNVVKLMHSFSSDNFKFLVYEYLPHMSLDRWLHYENEASSSTAPHGVLDWPTRKRIMIGAAHGLSYMHHDCVLPIVHRDIKSSNILLDLNFNAKIADFGLAKLMVKRGQPLSVSALAGSPGYFAPEYQRTLRVNEKTDVYSFGVVLLELVTGRQAHRGDEKTCLADWARRHVEQGKAIVRALDEKIKQPCCLDEICSVFNMGLNCTEREPSDRPSMKEVVHLLLKCGQ